MHVGNGLDGVMEAGATLSPVAEDLVVLHPADGMFYTGTNPAVLGVVVLLALQQWSPGAFTVRAASRS